MLVLRFKSKAPVPHNESLWESAVMLYNTIIPLNKEMHA